jgi:hypothetical protein
VKKHRVQSVSAVSELVSETRFLMLSEEHKLRVCENRMTGRWRKLHKEKLSDLCSLPSRVRMIKSRRMRWVGHAV